MNVLNAILNKMDPYFSRQSKIRTLVFCLLTVLSLGGLDFLTGYDLSFSIFYLMPISLAAWYLDVSEAMAISIASYFVLTAADFMAGMKYPLHPLVHVWNEFIRLVFFLIFAYLVSKVRLHLNEERALSRVDHLTQIPNRRAFYEIMEAEILRARRQPHPTTVAYFDIDRFKQMNDRFGHAVGDQVLQAVAGTIKSSLRETDTVARMGGDEFAVILPHSGALVSNAVIQNVRNRLIELASGHDWPIGFSVGCATFIRPPISIDELVHRADQLMYSCKKNGGSIVRHEVINQFEAPNLAREVGRDFVPALDMAKSLWRLN